MFGRTKAKFSSQFNRQAIFTHRFGQNITIRVGEEFTGAYHHSIASKSIIWAEATPVSKGIYTVKEKELRTHGQAPIVSEGSVLYKRGITSTFGNQSKTLFTRDEAISVLKSLEKNFEKDGYTPTQKQPHKKRIYTNKEAPTSKTV